MGNFFLFLVSIALIVSAVIMILAPKKIVKWGFKLLDAKEPRYLGLLPLFIGIFLLLSAGSSVLAWLIVLLGLAEIGKAVYVFLTPVARIKAHPWFNLPDNAQRAMGILILILGVLIFISRI